MTLTIPDVDNWKPEQLGTAGEHAGTISQGLDTAVGNGVTQTKALDDKWSGAAGAAANARMDTEKTKASAVSAALLELKTALTAQVGNLVEAKAKVVQLRDDAINQSPPFDVEPNGTVNATTRIAALRAHADKADVEGLVLQEQHQAATRTWDLTNALKSAETVANQAKTQVDAAITKLDQAFAGLGEPSANVAPAATTTPAGANSGTPANNTSSHGSPVSKASPVSSSNSDRPNYAMGNYNSGSGSPSSSAPTGPLPSGDMAKWIAEAKQKLIEMGYDPKDIDERAIAMIIEHESAGNPYAENRWDSNWEAGHPSKGLMQTIDSTFNAYKAPGHDDIWNPVDNIIAGVRYSIDRYGSVNNVPGVVAVGQGRAYQGY
ncbi:transglycosylase SLT domain-containing protein [Nocardia sp. NPDC049149]|uniref:transglycosylase SLT domain-containing protein n=1 Tax=Nocardia sp. NPDC049149 TaxID=3364315 RepID=UPI0037163375